MKLLFDQNISFRILKYLHESFADCVQVNSVGLHGVSDIKIWQFAKENNFTIVTFDADFVDIAHLRGFPPKIIWLRTGNTTTQQIANMLNQNSQLIDEFIADDNLQSFCLELSD